MGSLANLETRIETRLDRIGHIRGQRTAHRSGVILPLEA
jgi:hypothetical protein